MCENPLVSIVIPVFNHEKYVSETLHSVMNQDYDVLELVLLNDGSRDGSHEEIIRLDNTLRRRFKNYIYINKENEGTAKTLNRGIRLAKGEYIFLLASDDIVFPNTIKRLVEVAEHQDNMPGLVCGDAEYIDKNSEKVWVDENRNIARCIEGEKRYETFLQYYLDRREDLDLKKEFGSYKSFLRGNYIPVGFLVNRQAMLKVGLYDENNTTDDYDMWLKLSKQYKFIWIDEVLAQYRLHGLNTFITRHKTMMRDLLRILKREKDYCYGNGLKKEWKDSYSASVCRLIIHGQLKTSLEYIDRSSIIPILIFSLKKICKKLFGVFVSF